MFGFRACRYLAKMVKCSAVRNRPAELLISKPVRHLGAPLHGENAISETTLGSSPQPARGTFLHLGPKAFDWIGLDNRCLAAVATIFLIMIAAQPLGVNWLVPSRTGHVTKISTPQ